MQHRHMFSAAALSVSALALTLAPATPASTSPPKVSVRIEGKSKTLLAATMVRTHGGSITKDGVPTGICPASSAQGALDVATKGQWAGTYEQKYQSLFVTKILGDRASGTKLYWELLVNDVASPSGACGTTLHSGDRVVFAVVPSTGQTAFPIGVTAPKIATVGQKFTVKVVSYNAKGRAKPLAGATVTTGTRSARTSSKGVATFTPSHTGTVKIGVSKTGYIRDEAKVRVS